MLLSVGVTVLLARVLGAHDFGIYAYALAVVTLIAVPAQFGIPMLVLRHAAGYEAQGDWERLRGLLRRAAQAVLALAAALALIAGGIGALLAERLPAGSFATFAWALLLLPLLALSALTGAAVRGLRHVVAGQLSESVGRQIPLLALVGAALALGYGLSAQTAMALHAVSAGLALGVGVVLLKRWLPDPARQAKPRYEDRAWARTVLPLALMASAHALSAYTDVVMLGLFRPAAEVGVYQVAAQTAMLVVFGLGAVNMVVAPNISRLHALADHARLQRMVTGSARVVLAGALPVAFVLILLGGVLLEWVFGAEFARGHAPLAILAAGQLVNAAAGSVGFLLNMTGHERDTAVGVGIAAVANVLLNLALIPPFGMVGAAAATAVTLAAWNVILCRQVYRRIGIVSSPLVPTRRFAGLKASKGPGAT